MGTGQVIGGAPSLVLLSRAAAGDLSAIESLADNAASHASSVRDLPSVTEALVLARMAAFKGTIAQRGRVLGLLAIAGEACRDESVLTALQAEGIGWLSLMQESGEASSDWLEQGTDLMVDFSSSEAVEASKEFRATLLEAFKE